MTSVLSHWLTANLRFRGAILHGLLAGPLMHTSLLNTQVIFESKNLKTRTHHVILNNLPQSLSNSSLIPSYSDLAQDLSNFSEVHSVFASDKKIFLLKQF